MARHNQQPLFQHRHIIRLGRILDMLYKPAELAEEMDISVETIYETYIPAGMPCTRDERRHYWISGLQFVAWVKEIVTQRKKRHGSGLEAHQAYCLKCNAAVEMIQPTARKISPLLQLNTAQCPSCGRPINKISRIEAGIK